MKLRATVHLVAWMESEDEYEKIVRRKLLQSPRLSNTRAMLGVQSWASYDIHCHGGK
jgi:hypothetical protein